MTLGVAGSAGKANAAWLFQQTPPTVALPKVHPSGEG